MSTTPLKEIVAPPQGQLWYMSTGCCYEPQLLIRYGVCRRFLFVYSETCNK